MTDIKCALRFFRLVSQDAGEVVAVFVPVAGTAWEREGSRRVFRVVMLVGLRRLVNLFVAGDQFELYGQKTKTNAHERYSFSSLHESCRNYTRFCEANERYT